MTDNELIHKILAGNIDDYALLIDRHQHKLQSALAFYCQSTNDVQHYLHESFVMAYTKLSQFNQEYSFYPWLKKISLNLLRGDIRKNKSLSERAVKYMEMQLNADDEHAQEDDKLTALQGCINELETGQQQLLKNRYWQKESIDTLASKLDRKPSALKMQVMRIRESLKKCIKLKMELENAGV
ncbi:MAG: sigma-70 family RNA polymerase sigma factor [Lentisphaerales bacterium]|nr:sigma-70 family RNA polymerase sigma factor [Lentisphaerales bacterium]